MFDHLVQVSPQFLLACLVLAALPGPASVLCLHRTLRDGPAVHFHGAQNVIAAACHPLKEDSR
jgi:threonine/homoserine/homoserine lactone efflux protein